MRITAVTCVKNEGPFLLEWIAFHRLIGITDFLFYTNDCTDGTDALLDALALRGGVVRLPNPATGRNYQMEALKDARRHPLVAGADWVWIADVDEFLNIHAGDHTIPALIAACSAPQAISVTFQFFANAGSADYVDAPVIGQFCRTHNPDLWCAETSIEVKTLVRQDFPVKYYGAHRPFCRAEPDSVERPHWTDGSGRDVPEAFRIAANPRRIRKFPARGARMHATLNHYALRSRDSYLVKVDRGDVNRDGRSFDDTYWRERNDAAFEETSILRHMPALTAALARMKADPDIAALHEVCVSRHRQRRDALLADPETRALYDQLGAARALPPAEETLIRRLGLPLPGDAPGAPT